MRACSGGCFDCEESELKTELVQKMALVSIHGDFLGEGSSYEEAE